MGSNDRFLSSSQKSGYADTDEIGAGIFESSPDCVKLLDLEGRLLRVNRNGLRLMEFDEAVSLMGVAWQSLVPASSRNLLTAALAQARRGEVSRFEASCPTAAGKQKWWDITISPIRRHDEVTHLLSVSRDITELVQSRERAEEAARINEASNNAKAAFAASISHEIRTPLNAILGFAQLLLKAEADAPKRKSLEKIHSAGQRLVSVVDDMLDLAMADAGNLVLSERDFRLRDVLERVRQGAEDASNHSVRLTFKDQTNVGSEVSGDPARLFQVLINGTNSALRQARGEVEIVVRVDQRSAEAVLLRFEVTHDGPALSEASIESLLGSFNEAHAAAARKGGTGLGIAVRRRLVRAMGGEIGFQGCTFWFTTRLRLRPADGTAMATFNEPPSALAGKRVLLVDDDALNLEVAKTLLEMAGVVVETAENGKLAVEAVQRGTRFDAVLMDMLMPVMNGLDATRGIRSLPGSSLLPVIAMTANVRDSDRQAFVMAGANDFISKPVDTGKLWSVVAHWTCQPRKAASEMTRAGQEDAFFQPTVPGLLS